MSSPIDFDSLIRDAVNQDNGALETLLLWHYDDLAGYIERKMTARDRRRFDPEDVIQHAHRSVFLNINLFQGSTENEFVKWLFVCAGNALRDIRRHYNSSKRSGHRNHVRLDSVGMTTDVLQLAMHDPTPSQDAIRREEVVELQRAISQLSEADQDLVSLRFVKQLTLREIAEVRNASVNEMKYACKRAMRRLQRLMSSNKVKINEDSSEHSRAAS